MRSRQSDLEAIEQVVRAAERGELRVDELLATVPPSRDEPCSLEDRDVLLHGGDAHRVAAGERRDAVLLVEREGDDVSPGRVGKSVEHPVGLLPLQLIYNHKVANIARRPCRPLDARPSTPALRVRP